MCGSATLAMVVSSACMMVASMIEMVIMPRCFATCGGMTWLIGGYRKPAAGPAPAGDRSVRTGGCLPARTARRTQWMAQPHQGDQREEQQGRYVEDVVGGQHEGL